MQGAGPTEKPVAIQEKDNALLNARRGARLRKPFWRPSRRAGLDVDVTVLPVGHKGDVGAMQGEAVQGEGQAVSSL